MTTEPVMDGVARCSCGKAVIDWGRSAVVVADALDNARHEERIALAAAGRLLPEPDEVYVEWGVRPKLGPTWSPNTTRRESAEYHARRTSGAVVAREVREFDDGSVWLSPWTEPADAADRCLSLVCSVAPEAHDRQPGCPAPGEGVDHG